jgi:hypothetical protein
MSEYNPPTENLPEFNSQVFRSLTDSLTFEEADLRYLRFPLGQGNETIPNLVVQGTSQVGSLAFSDLTTYGKVDYPVNSGQTRFYNNNAVGTSVYAAKVDSTGLHTLGSLNTIDETGGALTIAGTNSRTAAINIGTGTGTGRTITVGSGNSTVSLTGTCNLAPSAAATGDVVKIADDNIGGTVRIASAGGISSSIIIGGGASSTQDITIGTAGMANAVKVNNLSITGGATSVALNPTTITHQVDIAATQSSGTLNIGSLAARTGSINIGNGASASAGTIGIGRSNVIAIVNQTTPTLTIAQEIRLTYSGLISNSSALGYTENTNYVLNMAIPPTANTRANMITSGTPAGSFTLGNGVWLVSIFVKLNYTVLGTNPYFRITLAQTSAGGNDTSTQDFQPNIVGDNFLNAVFTQNAAVGDLFYVVGTQANGTKTLDGLQVKKTRIG